MDYTKKIADELHIANKHLKKIADYLTPVMQRQMNGDEVEELMDEFRKTVLTKAKLF